MYKVTAIRNGKEMEVTKLEINENGEVFAVWFKDGGSFPWSFPKNLDEFRIEEVK